MPYYYVLVKKRILIERCSKLRRQWQRERQKATGLKQTILPSFAWPVRLEIPYTFYRVPNCTKTIFSALSKPGYAPFELTPGNLTSVNILSKWHGASCETVRIHFVNDVFSAASCATALIVAKWLSYLQYTVNCCQSIFFLLYTILGLQCVYN